MVVKAKLKKKNSYLYNSNKMYILQRQSTTKWSEEFDKTFEAGFNFVYHNHNQYFIQRTKNAIQFVLYTKQT